MKQRSNICQIMLINDANMLLLKGSKKTFPVEATGRTDGCQRAPPADGKRTEPPFTVWNRTEQQRSFILAKKINSSLSPKRVLAPTHPTEK